jgi:hypothetical protein
MGERADLFRRHGPDDRAKFGAQRPSSPLRAMQDIAQCRTERWGGQRSQCEHCRDSPDRYHSWKNRHCPKCHNDQAEQWLESQQKRLLPVTPFLVTGTLPEDLRGRARSHQQTLYNRLCRASSEAFQALAVAPRFMGGRSALGGRLQTWTRALRSPPPVPSRATGGGLAADDHWRASRPAFLVPVKPLAVLCRAQFRDGLPQTTLFPRVDAPVWPKAGGGPWAPLGRGQAALRYLAPDMFRVAISTNRLLKLADGQGPFPYQDSATAQGKMCPVPAEECMRRFLPHVLPHRFVKGRYDGLLSPGHRPLRTRGPDRCSAVGPSQPRPAGKGERSKNPQLPPGARGAGAPWSSCTPSSPRGASPQAPACTGFPALSTGADAASAGRR